MRHAALRDPTALPITQRVLAISPKRHDKPALGHLTRNEITALLAAPNPNTWSGHRDAVLLAVLYNTGARVSELATLQISDLLLDRQIAVQLHGKGRKQRLVPLWKTTAKQLRAWLPRIDQTASAPVFPNKTGQPITRSGIQSRLKLAVTAASEQCPSLARRQISPHTIRHTTAMHLLQSGVDIAVIAMWLGHEDTATTHIYLEADLAMKQAALKRLHEPAVRPVTYKAPDGLLDFLHGL
jgi:site-specific recombinase XerD